MSVQPEVESNDNRTILVVDDEPMNRRVLELFLGDAGYRTISVGSARAALEAVEKQIPALILLDVLMPEMDGFQLVALLKANHATRHVPVIMVTSVDDHSGKLAGLDAGAEEFLIRPVDRAELLLRVRNLLRGAEFTAFIRLHHDLLEQEISLRTADLQRFRTAMDATADAIFLVSRKTMRFVELNATACRMFGYSRQELFDMGPEQLSAHSHNTVREAYGDMFERGSGSNQLVEQVLRRKDGSELTVEIFRQALQSGSEWIVVAVVRDISERKRAQQRIDRLAQFDILTGLPNRATFQEKLERAIGDASSKDARLAVLVMDLDLFKTVNDMLGHASGDLILVEVGDRILQNVRVRDTVSRFGGDLFAFALATPHGQRDAVAIAKKILQALLQPFAAGGHEFPLTASIGISMFPDDASDGTTLIRNADAAMYRAKQDGRNAFRFFTPKMNVEMTSRLELESALRQAVERGEFFLEYQPKLSLISDGVSGAEALLRWQRPGHGVVPPGVFIPVLEEMGLIVQVGSWVIEEACRQIKKWQDENFELLSVSVNVSSRQFEQPGLVSTIQEAIRSSGIAASLLEIELTESLLMVDLEHTLEMLREIKLLGVSLSIDDFGTGYSSLAYLRSFPIDKLKIDIAFIRDITRSEDDAVIALTILQMARSLRLKVVAEGVETVEQLDYLRRHGCGEVQGYVFSRPLGAPACADFCAKRNSALALSSV